MFFVITGLVLKQYASITIARVNANDCFAHLKQQKRIMLEVRHLFNVCKRFAKAGSRTRVECLEGIHADRYTTFALVLKNS